MNPQMPRTIELTPEEQALLAKINFDPRGFIGDDLKNCTDSACELTKSLIKRDAIPSIRRKYFNDPEFNIPSKKSRKEVFEENGSKGEALLKHPHFLKYLRYFIYGPDLPVQVTQGLWKILDDDSGTSGMVLDQVQAFVRASVRNQGLESNAASEEFFKLALELGLDISYAKTIREAARSAK